MCGRTACTLAPDDICKACRHKTANGRWIQPSWKDSPDGNQYYPSYNLSPTSFSPILYSTKHVTDSVSQTDESNCSDWVVQPMRWGLIPSWHRGDASSIEYKMNNARSDGLLSKASFKKPLESGRRCVVLADGYYEWHTVDGKKQPYFIYFPQQTNTGSDGLDINKNGDVKVKLEDIETRECEATDLKGCTGKRLLTMAGLFDVWKPRDNEQPLFSYSVITVDAHSKLAWMHDRMPAILDGEDEIKAWLDYESVPLSRLEPLLSRLINNHVFNEAKSRMLYSEYGVEIRAMNLIRPTDCVQWHAVSSLVGNSRNKSEECIKPYLPELDVAKKPSASAKMMKAWLSAGTKRCSTESANMSNKKHKD